MKRKKSSDQKAHDKEKSIELFVRITTEKKIIYQKIKNNINVGIMIVTEI